MHKVACSYTEEALLRKTTELSKYMHSHHHAGDHLKIAGKASAVRNGADVAQEGASQTPVLVLGQGAHHVHIYVWSSFLE